MGAAHGKITMTAASYLQAGRDRGPKNWTALAPKIDVSNYSPAGHPRTAPNPAHGGPRKSSAPAASNASRPSISRLGFADGYFAIAGRRTFYDELTGLPESIRRVQFRQSV